GFVPEGLQGATTVSLEPCVNRTHLQEAGMVLDSHLERAFADMGMLSGQGPKLLLSCTITAASPERITAGSLSATDTYRLILSVQAHLSDPGGTEVWKGTFSDQGVFKEGGQAEDALDESCRLVSLQIARAVAAWRP
ncbi:MAG TPA: hypothetical protein PLU54_08005, partial [Deltaproteobacteria bacterium]|nr:hypothetical protein [Deltaproteobacteria bacterium]